MNYERHGLSIGLERADETFFLTLKVVGKLTHEDYLVITPMIDSALEGITHPTINALIDGVDFSGWELRAAWDDFRLGVKHGREFEKIAIIGNKKWQEHTAKIGSWFMSGEVRYFEKKSEALDWLR